MKKAKALRLVWFLTFPFWAIKVFSAGVAIVFIAIMTVAGAMEILLNKE